MNSVKIDRDLCTSCGVCFDACFVNVFRWDDAEDAPVVAYPEDCVECNKCELFCPVDAIAVVPDYDGIWWPQIVSPPTSEDGNSFQDEALAAADALGGAMLRPRSRP